MSNDDFDWKDESVCIEMQPATAVYRNSRNGVVIRQEDTSYEIGDQSLYFATDADVRTLIAALRREIGDAP